MESVVTVEKDEIGDALASQPRAIDFSGPIVLYGAGALGRWTLDAMRKAGMPDPVAFWDQDEHKWSPRHIPEGEVPVIGHQRYHALFRDNPLVVVTIFTGAKPRKEMEQRGCRTCSFAEFYRACLVGKPGVTVPYGSLDRPEAIRKHEKAIRLGLGLWADEQSRQEYVGQVRYRVSLDDSGLTPSLDPKDIYFPPEIPWQEKEVFVDCGAFDGDSIGSFLKHVAEHNLAWGLHPRAKNHGVLSEAARIVAIEPDPINAVKLRAKCASDRIKVVQAALTDRPRSIRFNATGTAGSRIADEGITVEAMRLDDILKDERPTRIKMDIEGAEPEALRGCTETIKRWLPSLAICLYHSPEHLWETPLWVESLVPGAYDHLLRRYSDDCWELVYYAIPKAVR